MLVFFFFTATASTEIYTLSLHDALPILPVWRVWRVRALPRWRSGRNSSRQQPEYPPWFGSRTMADTQAVAATDRKSTRLNSSHSSISYAVFCLKKKKKMIFYLLLSILYV